MEVTMTGPFVSDELAAFKLEMRLQQSYIEQLHALLREHGIPLPAEDSRLGASGAEHLEQCKAVVTAAYELVQELERLKAMIGSGHELYL